MSTDLRPGSRSSPAGADLTLPVDQQVVAARAFWWLYAHAYDAIWHSPLTHQVAAVVLSAAPPQGTVVDVGCGTGLVGTHYRAAGYHVTGVDISIAMLRLALLEDRISAGVHADATTTPLPSGGASTVLLCNVLHLQHDPQAVLREASRLAQPAGLIVVTWPIAGLTPARLRAIDRATGRGWLASLRADVLRRLVGIMFTYSREPLRSDGELWDVIRAATTNGALTAVFERTVLECQRVIVLRTSPAAGREPRLHL